MSPKLFLRNDFYKNTHMKSSYEDSLHGLEDRYRINGSRPRAGGRE
jgi:hypothetical protein